MSLKIVLCELYNEVIHGKDPTKKMWGHYIVMDSFQNIYEDEEEDKEEDEDEEENYPLVLREEKENFYVFSQCLELHQEKYETLRQQAFFRKKHPLIRAYHRIVADPNYIQGHIAECHTLDKGEIVAIIKTHWLRLIQRVWKRVYKERREMEFKRRHPSSLTFREIYGKWPTGLRSMPSITGMMSNLISTTFT